MNAYDLKITLWLVSLSHDAQKLSSQEIWTAERQNNWDTTSNLSDRNTNININGKFNKAIILLKQTKKTWAKLK